jgi:hypothetical protein
VIDMVNDEAFNRTALGELALKMLSKHGVDVGGADGLTLRVMIKELARQFPTTKKLHAKTTAVGSPVETAYAE